MKKQIWTGTGYRIRTLNGSIRVIFKPLNSWADHLRASIYLLSIRWMPLETFRSSYDLSPFNSFGQVILWVRHGSGSIADYIFIADMEGSQKLVKLFCLHKDTGWIFFVVSFCILCTLPKSCLLHDRLCTIENICHYTCQDTCTIKMFNLWKNVTELVNVPMRPPKIWKRRGEWG